MRCLAAAAVATGLVVLGPVPAAPAAEPARVLMVDNEPDLTAWHYEPAEITVPAGATVVWFNKGKEEHTATADDKSFDSGMRPSGTSWQRTFSKPGRYTYYCRPHPWMKGAVSVVAAGSAAGRTASGAGEAPTTQTSATTAPPSTTTTIPPTFAPPAGDQGAATPAPSATTTSAGPAPETDADRPDEEADEEVAAGPDGDGSGDGLPGTLAIVLVPTLAGLALGAKLRQRASSAGA